MGNIDLGTIGEAEFFSRAVRNGLKLSKPCGTYPYDYIVDNGKSLKKVQVKSTACFNKKAYSYTVSVKRKQKKNDSYNYTTNDADFMALYVVPFNTWYIVPIKEVINIKGLALFPHVAVSTSKWEIYKEAWGLLND